VLRLLLRYAKRGRLRFASHRDFARVLERALRRAGIPMAYSSGFSPHPRISYLNSAPTGMASEAEWLELGLAAEVAPDEVADRLNAALPEDFRVLEAVVGRRPEFTTSTWLLDVGQVPGLADAVSELLAADSAVVRREAKDRDVEVRPAIVKMEVLGDGKLEMTLRIGSPLVRPDDVAQALARRLPALNLQPISYTRVSQNLD
jgi:radical SAM-linked protein